MRWLVFAVAAISLSGCGLPPIISVASLALDFASYGMTGKTIADHGLSMVMQQDCALLRGLEGEICVEDGSELAFQKPAKEPETRASLRVAYHTEETNRMMSRRAIHATTLLSAFLTDPDITPGSAAAGTSGDPSRGRDLILGQANYLRDDVRLTGRTLVLRPANGAGVDREANG